MREFLLWVKGELVAGRVAELLAELGAEIGVRQSLAEEELSDKDIRNRLCRFPEVKAGEMAMVAGLVTLLAGRPDWEAELVAILGAELDQVEQFE